MFGPPFGPPPDDMHTCKSAYIYGAITNSLDLIIAAEAFKIGFCPFIFISLIMNRKYNGTLIAVEGSSAITRIPIETWSNIRSQLPGWDSIEEGRQAVFEEIMSNGVCLAHHLAPPCILIVNLSYFDFQTAYFCPGCRERMEIYTAQIDRGRLNQDIQTMLQYFGLQLIQSTCDHRRLATNQQQEQMERWGGSRTDLWNFQQVVVASTSTPSIIQNKLEVMNHSTYYSFPQKLPSLSKVEQNLAHEQFKCLTESLNVSFIFPASDPKGPDWILVEKVNNKCAWTRNSHPSKYFPSESEDEGEVEEEDDE